MVNRLFLRDMVACLKFNGTTGSIPISGTGIPVSSNPATANFSVSSWINPFSIVSAGKAVYSEGNTADNFPHFTVRINTDSTKNSLGILYRTNNNTQLIPNIQTTKEIQLNMWTHICVTVNAGTVHVYINGVEDGNSAVGNFNYSPTNSLTLNTKTIGAVFRIANSNFWNGMLDDFGIYSRALSSDEVMSVFRYGVESILTNRLLLYKLDEGSGTTATDSSGNGNNGTITGATYSTNVAVKPRVAASGRVAVSGRVAIT